MLDTQTIGIMITATSVTIAALYYIFTVRINQRNSKIAITNSVMQTMLTEEAQRRWIDLINMEWTDYEDFDRKYGSDNNPENYAKRFSVWSSCNVLGHLLKKNVVDAETLYYAGALYATWIWAKFEPIIMEHRRRYSDVKSFDGLEYLAQEMLKITHKRDPSYEVPETFGKYIPDQ
jgi:hypothetical protein